MGEVGVCKCSRGGGRETLQSPLPRPSRHYPTPPPLSCSPWLTLPGPNAVLTGPVHGVRALAYVCFPVFALKQVISVVQLASAVQRIAAMDEAAARQRQRRLQ